MLKPSTSYLISSTSFPLYFCTYLIEFCPFNFCLCRPVIWIRFQRKLWLTAAGRSCRENTAMMVSIHCSTQCASGLMPRSDRKKCTAVALPINERIEEGCNIKFSIYEPSTKFSPYSPLKSVFKIRCSVNFSVFFTVLSSWFSSGQSFPAVQ